MPGTEEFYCSPNYRLCQIASTVSLYQLQAQIIRGRDCTGAEHILVLGHDCVQSLFQRNRPLRDVVREATSGISVIPAHLELSKVDTLFGKGYKVVNRLNTALQSEKFNDQERPVIIDCCPLIGVLSLNAIFASDCVIVPVWRITCLPRQHLALRKP
jgi:hypothetical protein